MATTERKAVATLSGGLDSSLALWLARHEGYDIALAITYDYGQRAAAREIAQAHAICERFSIPHQVIALPWFRNFSRGGSLLDTSRPVPRPRTSDLSDRQKSETSAKAVWVPNRNGVLIEIAAGFAEDLGADAVIVGFNREEAATFPDNSLDYLEALTASLAYSTASHVRVVSPTATLDKQQIVAEALRTGFPLELLWSCYEAGEKMCGQCESCARLKRALDENGVNDNARFQVSSLR